MLDFIGVVEQTSLILLFTWLSGAVSESLIRISHLREYSRSFL